MVGGGKSDGARDALLPEQPLLLRQFWSPAQPLQSTQPTHPVHPDQRGRRQVKDARRVAGLGVRRLTLAVDTVAAANAPWTAGARVTVDAARVRPRVRLSVLVARGLRRGWLRRRLLRHVALRRAARRRCSRERYVALRWRVGVRIEAVGFVSIGRRVGVGLDQRDLHPNSVEWLAVRRHRHLEEPAAEIGRELRAWRALRRHLDDVCRHRCCPSSARAWRELVAGFVVHTDFYLKF
jgi:hypothetical protein